jgi:serine protease
VIDSGLNLPHEDMGLKGDTISGTNDSGTGNWFDHGGPHGTHVAGTIAALNNGIGVRNVIGTNPSMHIIKVFGVIHLI